MVGSCDGGAEGVDLWLWSAGAQREVQERVKGPAVGEGGPAAQRRAARARWAETFLLRCQVHCTWPGSGFGTVLSHLLSLISHFHLACSRWVFFWGSFSFSAFFYI